MSRLTYAMPWLVVTGVCLAFYFFADQLFLMMYDLSGLLTKFF